MKKIESVQQVFVYLVDYIKFKVIFLHDNYWNDGVEKKQKEVQYMSLMMS